MIISIANQKGGTGKTTTTIVLSYLLAREGLRVLAVDFDPQASLTLAMRMNPSDVTGVSEILLDCISEYERRMDELEDFTWGGRIEDYVRTVNFMGARFDIIPANQKLEDIETQLKAMVDGDAVLSWVLRDCEKSYDVILVDNRPALDWLVINSLTASNYVLAPVELTTISLGGFAELLKIVARVKRKFNPGLSWLGVLPVKYEKRSRDMRSRLELLMEKMGDRIMVFDPVPKSVSLERMLHLDSAEELLKSVKTAKNVFKTYKTVANRIIGLVREVE